MTMKTSKKTDPDYSLSLDADDLGGLDVDESTTFGSFTEEPERDEVKEVRKETQKDTLRVLIWRSLVVLALVATAVAVIATTYGFLVDEQEQNFQVAFEQFSRTVGDAALEQQVAIRDGYRGLSNAITAAAESTGANWPFYTMPLFESYAQNFFVQSRGEMMTVLNKVEHHEREAYENYTLENFDAWMREGHMMRYGNLDKYTDKDDPQFNPFLTKPTPEGFVREDEKEDYFAGWSNSPPPINTGLINWSLRSIGAYSDAVNAAVGLRNEVVSTAVRPYSVGINRIFTPEEHAAFHSQKMDDNFEHPHSFMFFPIFERVEDIDSRIVGAIGGGIAWDASLRNLLPTSVVGIHAIITNNCNQSYTYKIDGPDAIYMGPEDLHEPKFDYMKREINLALHTNPDFPTTPGHCMFKMKIYPTSQFEDDYHTNTPAIFAVVLAATFVGVILIFGIYDWSVQSRNDKIVRNAAESNALLTAMLPSHLRDRVVNQKANSLKSSTKGLKGRLTDGIDTVGDDGNSKPLADLFLETTVMFADISGFTAWSSSREPSQVFSLLETVYQNFDKLAQMRRVYKVETNQDCYVAVTGIPVQRKDHAVTMARFASDCLVSFGRLVKQLEVRLGPDTGDLGLRVGCHSGPVTAGILRGERSRFQLFGDTMNTTGKMESSGMRGRIHVSNATAELLRAAGKGQWLTPRDDGAVASGLGKLNTCWLNVRKKDPDASETETDLENVELLGESDRKTRLIEWNLEVLLPLLKQIVARRKSRGSKLRKSSVTRPPPTKKRFGETVLDEVKEIIQLPDFDASATNLEQKKTEEFDLSDDVVAQLREFIKCISMMYRNNPFHNFEHASHVAMSVQKCLGRIVAPSDLLDDSDGDDGKVAASLHDHTYGITSDPLTQFACIFSALIHDVDHSGVPNTQVLVENPALGELYKNRSVAEQNSLDLSWDLLMESRFKDLRDAICGTSEELQRFRELVVNSVMATDIADKELKTLRNARWDKAFKNVVVEENKRDAVNRKATIVIEHLIQASDISHTMQHWHVYRKWNARLFEEMYSAYKEGRSSVDPASFWAKGEIGFFDFYIIPLAKKLKECGVFGVSSGEFLDYAMKNRQEWEEHGAAITAEMVQKLSGDNDAELIFIEEIRDEVEV